MRNKTTIFSKGGGLNTNRVGKGLKFWQIHSNPYHGSDVFRRSRQALRLAQIDQEDDTIQTERGGGMDIVWIKNVEGSKMRRNIS